MTTYPARTTSYRIVAKAWWAEGFVDVLSQHKRSAMRRICTFLLLPFVILTATAQNAPEIEWSRTYGGAMDDTGASIKQTPDGG